MLQKTIPRCKSQALTRHLQAQLTRWLLALLELYSGLMCGMLELRFVLAAGACLVTTSSSDEASGLVPNADDRSDGPVVVLSCGGSSPLRQQAAEL